MSNTEFKKMKDVELLRILFDENSEITEKDKVKETLYLRYENQIHKNWQKLCSQLGKNPLAMSLEDEYYGEAVFEFFRAINKIDMSKVKDDNFKCVGMVDWYLKNLRKKIINSALKRNKRITSANYWSLIENENSNEIDPNIEASFWESEGYTCSPDFAIEWEEGEKNCRRAEEKCMKKWTPFEREVYNLLKDEKSRKEIAEILNVKVTKVYTTSNNLKKDLKKALGM